MENSNTVKIVVPIHEDATMLSFASIAATNDDVTTMEREYDGEEIEEMKREYLMLASQQEDPHPVLTGVLTVFTILLTIVLIFLTTMFVVLWKWPTSDIAMWFDRILATIMDHMAGLNAMSKFPWF